jgi:hypothetical protein
VQIELQIYQLDAFICRHLSLPSENKASLERAQFLQEQLLPLCRQATQLKKQAARVPRKRGKSLARSLVRPPHFAANKQINIAGAA